MSDRELMERAAKAAGIVVGWRDSVSCLCYADSPYAVAWNPLADDGDALRLAVDLGLNIEFGNDAADYTVAWDGCIGSGKFYHHESDRRNATRWAIVTVAAQADPKTHNAKLTGPSENQGRNDEHH